MVLRRSRGATLLVVAVALVLGQLLVPAFGRASSTPGLETSIALPGYPSSTVGGVTGPDGNLWVPSTGGQIYVVNPTSGAVNTVTIGGYNRITGLTAGPDGNMWGTVLQQTSTSAHVAVIRISPNGVVIPFTSGISSTDGLGQIVTGPDGNLWFTEGPNKRIGRMNPSNFSITEYTTPFEPGRLTADPSGYVWMYSNLSGSGFTTEFGRISTSNFSIPTYNFGYDVYDIAIGPDGAVWYAETTNVAVPTVTKWFPGGTSATYPVQYAGGGLTFAADGGLWVFESTGSQGQGNAQRLNPATGAVTDTYTLDPNLGLGWVFVGPDGGLWGSGSRSLTRLSTSVNPTITGPTISGQPFQGYPLVCGGDTWGSVTAPITPTQRSYTWFRTGTAAPVGNASTYTPVAADVGNALSCRIRPRCRRFSPRRSPPADR